MYPHEDYKQLKPELPFGVTPLEDSRWVILSKLLPWEAIDREYARNFTGNESQVALPSRLAFGALYIQTAEHFTDEQTRRNVQENPYLQYFYGFECYTMDLPFDASMMTRFCKRISSEMIQNIQARILVEEAVARQEKVAETTGEDAEKIAEEESSMAVEPALENHRALILDATCCPADIRYPADAGLLNQVWELVEQMVDILYDSVREKLSQQPRTYRQKARKGYLPMPRNATTPFGRPEPWCAEICNISSGTLGIWSE